MKYTFFALLVMSSFLLTGCGISTPSLDDTPTDSTVTTPGNTADEASDDANKVDDNADDANKVDDNADDANKVDDNADDKADDGTDDTP